MAKESCDGQKTPKRLLVGTGWKCMAGPIPYQNGISRLHLSQAVNQPFQLFYAAALGC